MSKTSVLSRLLRLSLAGAVLACGDSTAPSAAQVALWNASRDGDVTALAAALQQGADPNAIDVRTNDNGRRALNYAAEFNRPLAVRWLVQNGADMSLGNNRGFTPLHHAAEYGSLEAAVELLALGANPNAKLPSGSTPLAIAKLPSAGDAFFERVQASIARDSLARMLYPEPVAMMRRVVQRVTDTAVTVVVETAAGPIPIRLGAFEIQRMAADRVADPRGTALVLAAWAAADRGDWSALGAWAQRRTREPIFLAPMALAMDLASGVSPARRERVTREAPGAILGDALGYPVLHTAGAMDDLVLPEDFRAPFQSGHETLILAGDIDGRTPIAENRETASLFSRATFVTIINGGHSAGVNAPPAQQRIKEFFTTGRTSADPIVLPQPRWTP